MSDILLQIGTFQFSMNTAAYNELTRKTEYRWAKVERFGRAPGKQFTGLGNDVIALRGTIYPHWKSGLYRVDDMRALAALGKPQSLVSMPTSSRGVNMGLWVIESVEEVQGNIRPGGIPGSQKFHMKISAYGEGR